MRAKTLIPRPVTHKHRDRTAAPPRIAHKQQGHGFIYDVIGGQKSASLPGQFGLQAKGPFMMFIGGIP